jgi:hypothetical protein
MWGFNQSKNGRTKREVLWGAPSEVEALKIKAIQSTNGSQYLQIRPSTAAKNNGAPAKATPNPGLHPLSGMAPPCGGFIAALRHGGDSGVKRRCPYSFIPQCRHPKAEKTVAELAG